MNSLGMSLYLLSWSRNTLNSVELEVHCCVHKSPPLVPVLSQVNAVYIFPSIILGSILLLSCHLCLDLQSGIFPSSFPVSPLCVTCPTHPIPYLIIVMFTNREQEPYNSSVYAICFWPVKFSSRRLEVTFLYSNSNTTLVDKTKHVFYPLPSQPNLVQKLTNNLHTIHYSLHLLPPSYAHTAFLAPCSYTPSTYFVPSI